MATTDAEPGFGLPWSSDRSTANPETTDTDAAVAATATLWPATAAQAESMAATPAAPPAGQQVTPSGGTVSTPFHSAAPVAGRAPAKPTKFLVDLTRTMQAVAEAARDQTLSQVQADAKAFVELIRERGAAEAPALKVQAEADIDGIRTWSKAEIAGIRKETQARIAARRVELDRQVEQHAAGAERQIEMVHGSVSAFEREMARFFEELFQETDPGRFSAMAETLPEPPDFEDILRSHVEESSDAAIGTVEAADETEAADEVAAPDEPIELDEAAQEEVADADASAAAAETTEEASAGTEAAQATADRIGDEAPARRPHRGRPSAGLTAEPALAARTQSMGAGVASADRFGVDRMIAGARRGGDLRLLMRLVRRARPYWPHIACVLLLGLVASPLAILSPVPLKIVVDSVLGSQPLPGPLASLVTPGTDRADLLLIAVGLLAFIALASQIQGVVSELLTTWTGERLVMDFRTDLFQHVQRLSFAWSDARGTADSLYRIQYDAASIQYLAVDGVIPFVTSIVTVAGMIYVAAQIDSALALVALGVCPPLVVAIGAMRQRLRRGAREVKRLESGTMSVVQEALSAIRVVRAFGQEDRERDRFVDRSSGTLRARLRLVLAEGGFGLVIGLITAGGTAAALYVGVLHVQAGLITLGELLLVVGYLGQLYSPLTMISRKAGRLQTYLASAERAYAILDELPEVRERPGARPLTRASGVIEFDHVSFGYDHDQSVLRDVHLVVPAGARVGISGTTGAGKTTLVSLLSRFYDPTEGRLLLDGVDMRDYRLADLRKQFAIVLQEPLLFSTTIAENISYGKPGAPRTEIVAAAEAAGAASFIKRLPRGYDTPVGERGMRFSGGERQRIALARAFLKDAPILILDEPTSSVDVDTEAAIMSSLEDLMRGRTVFMIAHRMSTLALCDTLLRVERDRVVSITRRDTQAAKTAAIAAPTRSPEAPAPRRSSGRSGQRVGRP